MDLQKYLDRVGYSGPVAPDYPTLRALHVAHLLAVPFENLDIHAGRKITVGAEHAYKKIVGERRGGFCYEQNGLFGAVLTAIGFGVTYLSGRVARKSGGWGPEFDHLALLVEIPEDAPYLADVGFGESFREPLCWNDTAPQAQEDREYRLSETLEGRILSQKLPGKDWEDPYILSTLPRQLEDFAGMAHYHQTSPESGFTKNPLISQALPGGRISLTDKLFIVTRQGERTELPVTGVAAYFEKLEQEFGVNLLPELRQNLEGRVSPVTGENES
ncbi:MAG: arylamine N-acetyltransferase [Chloroflexi bacterium]|nr:arylamine N-acetyltransferase [Chloroflexota bacterium]OJV86758.1 MAG: hypothetical protein BGO39_12990 [Chloroflexi bacterium 54-19]